MTSVPSFVGFTEAEPCGAKALTANALKKFGHDPNDVIGTTGVERGAIAPPEQTPLDLARKVLEKFFQEHDLGPEDCNGLVVSHTSPDRQAAQRIAEELSSAVGIQDQRVIGICAGCTGTAEAIDRILQTEGWPEENKVIPIVAAEMPSKYIDARSDFAKIFRDRGAATALTLNGRFPILQRVVGPVELKGDRSLFRDVVVPEAIDVHGTPHQNLATVEMDGKRVFLYGVRLMSQLFDNALSELGDLLQKARVVVVPHQANLRLLEKVKDHIHKKRQLPEIAVVSDIAHKGNTESTSIPSALADLPELRNGVSERTVFICPSVGVCYGDENSMSTGLFTFSTFRQDVQ